ncbi:MAG: sugar phosphate isomerase/epimerase family protein [Candidatus Bathyarchaeia archaeon]|jgi:sugar phosphate isomerase/epimerase
MSKAKVGVSMLFCLGESFNRMVKRLGTMQTRYIEIVDDGVQELNKKRVVALKDEAKKFSLEFSVHAPFADINIASPSTSILHASLKRLKQSMAYANELNAKVWVFHPGAKTGISQFYPGAEWKQNAASVQELYKAAEEYGLNIALENLPGKYWFLMHKPEEFMRFYRETNLPIGIALDLGHAHLEAQIEPFFNLLADKIGHVHASDNDGSDDQHLGIGKGKIDYDWFKQTIIKTGYEKTIIIESVTDVTESIQKLRHLLA